MPALPACARTRKQAHGRAWECRRAIIEANLVDCMVALPGQLFYSTQIPACLWFLARDRKNGRFRDRRGETLFIDARKMGVLYDRVHRELTAEDIARIAEAYHAWRGDSGEGKYEDVPGFCKSATTEEIRKNGYVLMPGRYVGAEAAEDDGEPFEEKMQRLTARSLPSSSRSLQGLRLRSELTCWSWDMRSEGPRADGKQKVRPQREHECRNRCHQIVQQLAGQICNTDGEEGYLNRYELYSLG